jgi:hypothetical protein
VASPFSGEQVLSQGIWVVGVRYGSTTITVHGLEYENVKEPATILSFASLINFC